MKEDRLTILKKYGTDDLQQFLQTRASSVIRPDMQEYILQLDTIARLMHRNRLSVRESVEQLRKEWPELTVPQARSIYYDALDYYYFDDDSSAKSWDMVYADQLEDLKTLASIIPRFFCMSCCTFGVAVAVRAINGARPISFMMGRMFLYSGRKSWPHSEMQCDSSTA